MESAGISAAAANSETQVESQRFHDAANTLRTNLESMKTELSNAERVGITVINSSIVSVVLSNLNGVTL